MELSNTTKTGNSHVDDSSIEIDGDRSLSYLKYMNYAFEACRSQENNSRTSQIEK